MNSISILDCTLRDGGYLNDWKFGEDAIRGIVDNLLAAGIDIIECGFLREGPDTPGVSVFSDTPQIVPYLKKRPGTTFVAMIALGDIDPVRLSPWDGSSIDGIRLTFHKHQWEETKRAARVIQEKGYRLFLQPVGTTSYDDGELLRLLEDVNRIHPYGFYLVDTLGILYRHDVLRYYYLIDHNLDRDIQVGFHSHNNLQLSFSNAQELMRQQSSRDLIVDSSVYGMGRGVGNLPTELLAEYLNHNTAQNYTLIPLLTIADEYLMPIHARCPWGYALPYFLSAREKCHPNYASYLLGKETLSIEMISRVLSLLPADRRDLFHPELIESLYRAFQDCGIDDTPAREALRPLVQGREALLLAPGASIQTLGGEIRAYIDARRPVVFSVNFIPDGIPVDALFISNQKRLGTLTPLIRRLPCVVASSNLLSQLPEGVWFVNYASCLGEERAADNAGAMLVRLLGSLGAASISFAGFDGFGPEDNYAVPAYEAGITRQEADRKNADIQRQLRLALGGLPHRSITPTRYAL